MPRAKTIYSNELPYHITARCINREWFGAPKDYCYGIYINVFEECIARFGVYLFSFLLMDNHFHMILQSPNCSISEFLRFFMTESARGIKTKAKRMNQVYGSRNHKTLINDPRYLAHCYKYVARNPVSAGLVTSVEDYKWSTYSKHSSKMKRLLTPIQKSTLNEEIPTDKIELYSWLNEPLSKELERQNQMAQRKAVYEFGKMRSSRILFDPSIGLPQTTNK